MRAGRWAFLAVALFFLGAATLAAPRPELNSGACLSCHSRDVATLPSQPCIACHSGNMAFLKNHDGGDTSLWLIGAAGGGGLAVAALILLLGTRRLLPAAACLGIALFASAPSAPPDSGSLPGATMVAQGFACDLSPCLSPDGSALLFARRGPDTSGDGIVDLRDGLALFLMRRGWTSPKRVTPYTLDAQAAMAAWSTDGSQFALPLPASAARKAGLGLFDARGREAAFLASEDGEILAPAFSPDGSRLAFVEGSGIGLWDVRDGARNRALEPLSDGQFPRLYGWSLKEDAPLFTRGFDYARLERDRDNVRIFPAEVPVEIAREGRAVALTPPGASPLRRFKAQPTRDGVFYLAVAPHGVPGIYFCDGATETRWSPAGVAISGFAVSPEGTCWAWMAEGKGNSRLVRFEGPGRWADGSVAVRSNLAVLSLGTEATAWASGEAAPGEGRRLYKSGRALPVAKADWNLRRGLRRAGRGHRGGLPRGRRRNRRTVG